VRVVCATVGGTSVGVLPGTHNLASFWTILRELFFLTLQAGNVFGISAHPALTINLVTMAQIGECRQAKIDTNNLSGWRQRLGSIRTGKASVAVADRIALDRQRLHLSTDCTVQLHLDAANPGAYQTFSIKFESRLLEGE
jgi:hypothetical protein